MQVIPATIGVLVLAIGVAILVRGEPMFEFFFRRREGMFGKGALGGDKVSRPIQRTVAVIWILVGAACAVAALVGPPFVSVH